MRPEGAREGKDESVELGAEIVQGVEVVHVRLLSLGDDCSAYVDDYDLGLHRRARRGGCSESQVRICVHAYELQYPSGSGGARPRLSLRSS